MASREGQGLVAPKPVKVQLTSAELRLLETKAAERDSHRGYTASNSRWKQGSVQNPILIGSVGEAALQSFLSSRLKQQITVFDDSLNNGDGGIDVAVFGVRYQVKTSRRRYETVLVRRIDGRKKLVAHASQRYVFCAWNPGELLCWLCGWCSSETLRERGRLRIGRSANADWWNVELETCWLESMDSLVRQMKLEQSRWR